MATARLLTKIITMTMIPIAMPTGTTLTARLSGMVLAAIMAPEAMPAAQMPCSMVACDSV